MSRLPGRIATATHAARQALAAMRFPGPSAWPEAPRRILIAHRLLLGDTLLLTALLKKLRTRHPQAELVLTMARAFLPLYSGAPYGTQPLAFEPKDAASVWRIIASGPYDLALVPGDNRHSWLALAAGARHIVAHAGDVPAWKNWPVSAAVPYPTTPLALADLFARLAPGPDPEPYAPSEWPAPPAAVFARPDDPYAVLHVGASYSLKLWPAARWSALAAQLERRGLRVAWSAGPGEEDLVRAADPESRHLSYAGQLDLAQLWSLLARARLVVCLDTGVAHLARLIDVPTVALYGPGSALLVGAGAFWRNARFATVTEEPFPCRDQTLLFRRDVAWVRRCERRPPACLHAACMEALTTERVLSAARSRGWID